MIDLEAEERQVLEAARRALAPSPADAERVLAATRRALLAAAAAAAGGAALGTTANAMNQAFTQSALASARLWHIGLAPKVLAALFVAGASAGAGYYAARQAALRASRTETSVQAPAALARSKPLLREGAPRVTPQGETPPTSVRERALSEASQDATPQLSDPSLPRVRMRKTRRTEVASATAASIQTPTAASLAHEARMLARVERALRDDNPQQALILLLELDRTVPLGKLEEERAAAFAVARCSLGVGSPGQLVAAFSQRYPASVYFPRVRQSCARGEDSVLPTE